MIIETKTYNYQEPIGSFPEVSPREGYRLVGWFTARVGGTQVDTTTEIVQDATYYAHWEKNQYSITWNSNGGSSVSSWTNREYNTTLGSLPQTPTRTGYTFDGWYTTLTGGTQVTSSTVILGDATYYAHWNPIAYSITYDMNGHGTNPSNNPSSYTIESDTIIPSNPSDVSGYTFNGWNPTSISSGSTGTKKFTATWIENVVQTATITFNSNGGSSVSSKTIQINSTLGTLPTPTRTGYEFTGWFTAASDGTQVTESTKVTSNVTYYAHWNEIVEIEQREIDIQVDDLIYDIERDDQLTEINVEDSTCEIEFDENRIDEQNIGDDYNNGE